MSTAKVPNIDFGSPVIFFDSNPEEQESYLYSYWSSLRSTLKIAWTGEVPPFHAPGKLRIIFWTFDGEQGIKDYELHEYSIVREAWEALFNMPSVKRALVMGYSGQNPYVTEYGGSNPWVDTVKGEKRQARKNENMENSKELRNGKMLDIESVINKAEEAERKKQKQRELDAQLKQGETVSLLDV